MISLAESLNVQMPGVHLGEGGEAVGSAGCVGDDGGRGVKGLIVDAHDVGGNVIALGRGSDQHLPQIVVMIGKL